ncbi:hypothetical protein [Luteitalea pratensis]|uniref:hypothetical protein n=1 Tax=Luteitalea pratensis TaxID=1855912 RepID=UPI0012FFAC21|nr:hypothetical protein [Luteitalea pratensis]
MVTATRRSEGEADHGKDEPVRALEQIRPLALHAIPTAVRIWGRANLAQLPTGARILEHLRLRQQFPIRHGVARRRVGHLARANERVEEVGPRLRHVDAKDRSHEWPTRMIVSFGSCLRNKSASSIPSCVMRATVMVCGASGFFPNVLPAPR